METILEVLFYIVSCAIGIFFYWLWLTEGGRNWVIRKTLRFRVIETKENKVGVKSFSVEVCHAFLAFTRVDFFDEKAIYKTAIEAHTAAQKLKEKWVDKKATSRVIKNI